LLKTELNVGIWKQFLKQIFNEKIQKPSLLYGQLCEQARWIESCAVIGYPSGQDGAILPAQEYLLCPKTCKRKNSVKDGWILASFFFVSLWTSTLSLSVNTQKKKLGHGIEGKHGGQPP